MDGYCKNKMEAIKAVRKRIFYKYAVTFLIVIMIPVWLIAIVANQPPEKWTQAEVVFSHISREQIGIQRGDSDVLNTQHAEQYVIASKDVDIRDLKKKLVSGKTYSIVFSNSIAGGDHMEALSDDNTVFLDLDDSIARWKKEQKEAVAAIVVTFIVEIVALVLIDRLWCRNEHARIRKLKEDIEQRKARVRNRKDT